MIAASYLEAQQKLFGKRIATLRKEAGFKIQYVFGQKVLGATQIPSFISKIERGANINFQTIIKLANALEMPLLNLFDYNGIYPIVRNPIYNYTLEERMKKESEVLGKNIRRIRKSKKMTLLDTEIESGITNTNISNYELGIGFSKLDTITILAYGLKVEAYELFPLQ